MTKKFSKLTNTETRSNKARMSGHLERFMQLNDRYICQIDKSFMQQGKSYFSFDNDKYMKHKFG